MGEYTVPFLLGLIFGFVGRLVLLQNDYRQYPTKPHGSIIHIALGLIAAGLGSIAIPALLEGEYAAITFLALAAQHFREVRNMERETLTKIDEMELIRRGKVYIEGIAMVFESRNYLVIIVSFSVTLATQFVGWWLGVITGVAGIVFALVYKSGKKLHTIVDIEPAAVRFEGADLFVGDIHMMNVGLAQSKEIIKQQAIGLILTPKSVDSEVTLTNLGQRQAILHDLSVGLGIYKDEDKPSIVPLTRRDIHTGRLGVYFVPHIKNMERAMQVAYQVPILENAVRIPSESEASQTARTDRP
jgi:uncharacterized protein